MKRGRPHFDLERRLHSQGYTYVGGVDEAGRGPLAGPVSAGMAILPHNPSGDWVDLINDSKKLSPRQRDLAFDQLSNEAVALGVGFASSQEIDSIGISSATRLAIHRALKDISIRPQHLLLDAFTVDDIMLPQDAIVKGDSISLSVAAASIVAKVERDKLMDQYALIYPQYGFEKNKGYGTKSHLRAIIDSGLTGIHRVTFNKVRESAFGGPKDSEDISKYIKIVVTKYLIIRGYQILETNYPTQNETIEVVAVKSTTLVFAAIHIVDDGENEKPCNLITQSKRRAMRFAFNQLKNSADVSWIDWKIEVVKVSLNRLRQVKRIQILNVTEAGC